MIWVILLNNYINNEIKELIINTFKENADMCTK